MSLKKAVLVSCFNYYDIRLKHVEKYLSDNHYEVTYITSDYDHIAKEHYHIERVGAFQVHARPYKINLSFRRMLSHFVWARDTFKQIKALQPDLLFVMLPPNSLARHAVKYRKKNKIKLIFDVYDLWPETYPLPTNPLMKPPFYLWKRMRDKYLKYADLVTTECDLFREKLENILKGIRVETLYPTLEDVPMQRQEIWDDETVHLAYLGSINNIINIPLIAQLVSDILKCKPVHLHIIGTGESKNELIASVKNVGAKVTDYGVVYDLQKKQDILDRCRFGLNIMRNTVCVGLTMKSIDYFRAGLPIVNTIQGDTFRLAINYDIGYNILNDKLVATKIACLTERENFLQRQKARDLYNSKFSPIAFHRTFGKILEE